MQEQWSAQSCEFFRQMDTALAAIGSLRRNSNIVQEQLREIAAWGFDTYNLTPFGHFAMIDDEPEMLGKYVPALIYSTRGAASQVLYRAPDTLQNVQQQISLIRPDVVLIDYRLNSGSSPCGTDVIPLLRELNREIACIGFSTNESNASKFLAAGADGFVRKGDPLLSVTSLRELLHKRQVRSERNP